MLPILSLTSGDSSTPRPSQTPSGCVQEWTLWWAPAGPVHPSGLALASWSGPMNSEGHGQVFWEISIFVLRKTSSSLSSKCHRERCCPHGCWGSFFLDGYRNTWRKAERMEHKRESWVPVTDSIPSWVSLAQAHFCSFHPKAPSLIL